MRHGNGRRVPWPQEPLWPTWASAVVRHSRVGPPVGKALPSPQRCRPTKPYLRKRHVSTSGEPVNNGWCAGLDPARGNIIKVPYMRRVPDAECEWGTQQAHRSARHRPQETLRARLYECAPSCLFPPVPGFPTLGGMMFRSRNLTLSLYHAIQCPREEMNGAWKAVECQVNVFLGQGLVSL